MRDKAWLKEEVYKLIEGYISFGGHEHTFITGANVNKLGVLIDQLDEPQKPVVPQFVADYIEYHKVTGLTLGDWLDFVNDDEFEGKTQGWIYSGSYEENLKREYLLIDAIRYGYEVEKEKLYYVLDKEDATLLKKSAVSEGVAKSVGTNMCSVKSWKDEEKYQLTEQEIKDYDERFWAFAQEVTEWT